MSYTCTEHVKFYLLSLFPTNSIAWQWLTVYWASLMVWKQSEWKRERSTGYLESTVYAISWELLEHLRAFQDQSHRFLRTLYLSRKVFQNNLHTAKSMFKEMNLVWWNLHSTTEKNGITGSYHSYMSTFLKMAMHYTYKGRQALGKRAGTLHIK